MLCTRPGAAAFLLPGASMRRPRASRPSLEPGSRATVAQIDVAGVALFPLRRDLLAEGKDNSAERRRDYLVATARGG
jgi:hypothetical protein